jgi:glycosyltransferase involved in cell wall biosynthesis
VPDDKPIRIGINALFLIPGGVGGTEIYIRNLLAALGEADSKNQYFVIRNAESTSDLVPKRANFVDCPQPVRAAFRPARIAYEQTILVGEIMKLKLDVLLNAGTTAPLLSPVPMVTVFYDLQYKRHPEFFRWFDLPFWRILMPASARRSKRIVAMSESARADLVAFFPWTRNIIDIIPHAVEDVFSKIALRRDEVRDDQFVLAVSTLHPHKNLAKLIEAFAEFRKAAPTYRLVVVGLKGFETESLLSLRTKLGLEESVEFPGWIPRDDLYDLFTRARAFIYPSRFEGFGIPVLEAMTAGIPTACSSIPPLREIGADAVRYFDPDSAADIRDALFDVTHDDGLRAKLRALGPQRAARYSWATNARRLASILVSVARFQDAPHTP